MSLVYGTLDDAEVLENEAAEAEIVLHFASSDHVGAAEAISRGLKKIGGYWIHTSGTDILLLQPSEGQKGVKTFDDWDGIEQCTSRPGTLTPVGRLRGQLLIPACVERHLLRQRVSASVAASLFLASLDPTQSHSMPLSPTLEVSCRSRLFCRLYLDMSLFIPSIVY